MLAQRLKIVPSAEKAAATVARLEAKLAQATVDAEAATAEVAAAAFALEGGSSVSPDELKAARVKLDKANKIISESQAALPVAKAKLESVDAEATAKETAAVWDRIQEMADRRVELAHEIQTLIALIGGKLAELMALGDDAYAALPIKPKDTNWTPCNSKYTLDYFRIGLLKINGWRWASPWPWEAAAAPEFVEKIKEGSAFLLAGRKVKP